MRICAKYRFCLSIASLSFALAAGGCNSSANTLPTPKQTAAREAADAAPAERSLQERLGAIVDFTCNNRHLNTRDHAAWQVVHGILCYGRELQIYHDQQLVEALGYLLKGGKLKGWDMRPTDHGVLGVLEAGSKTGQGHEDQWMGYLALAGVQPDEQMVVNGEAFTVNDLVTEAQWHMKDGMEATWPLMAYACYLPLDSPWKASDGSEWTIERVVGMEAAQDLSTSACGGTHRLVGLVTAVDRYKKEHPGVKLTGAWLKADEVIKASFDAAKKYQQPNGRFSTSFFQRPGTSDEIDTQLHATGHTLEFVVLAADDNQIREPWIERAVADLVNMLEETKEFDLECGGLYHAARGLKIYGQRRWLTGATGESQPASEAQPTSEPNDKAAREAPLPR